MFVIQRPLITSNNPSTVGLRPVSENRYYDVRSTSVSILRKFCLSARRQNTTLCRIVRVCRTSVSTAVEREWSPSEVRDFKATLATDNEKSGHWAPHTLNGSQSMAGACYRTTAHRCVAAALAQIHSPSNLVMAAFKHLTRPS